MRSSSLSRDCVGVPLLATLDWAIEDRAAAMEPAGKEDGGRKGELETDRRGLEWRRDEENEEREETDACMSEPVREPAAALPDEPPKSLRADTIVAAEDEGEDDEVRA